MTALAILIGILVLAAAWAYLRASREERLPAPGRSRAVQEVGYTVLIAHRRASGKGREALQSDWGPPRAALVGGQLDRIGAVSYAQVHQVPRLTPVYVLVRLSRSWPVAAILSVMHGLPVPRPRGTRRNSRLEDWDLVEMLEFSDRGAASRFLEHEDLADLRKDLARDAKTWAARSQVVPMTTTEAYRDARADDATALTLFFLRAQPAIDRSGMVRYWLDLHRPFVLSMTRDLGFPLYRQLVAEGAETLEDAAYGFSGRDGMAWDGVAVLAAPGLRSLTADLLNPRVQAANLALLWDETRFIDLPGSSLVLGELANRYGDIGPERIRT